MPRTVINLDPEDKQWLDREARAQRVPMTELVRQAVHSYRLREEARAEPELHRALSRTAGIWKAGNGLAYQRELREEWSEQR